MNAQHMLGLAALGCLASIVAIALIGHSDSGLLSGLGSVGLLFGITISAYYLALRRARGLLRSFLFISITALSSTFAFMINYLFLVLLSPLMYLMNYVIGSTGSGLVVLALGVMAGGFVNSILVVTAFEKLISPLQGGRLFVVCNLGAVLSLLGPVGWSTGMAALLGWATAPREA